MNSNSTFSGAQKPDLTRVLIAIPSMGLGGSERVMLTLLRNLNAAQFELHLATLVGDGARLKDVPSHVHVHQLRAKRARHAVASLAALCWKLRPHAVLSTSAHLNTAVIAARPMLPPHTALLTREGADIIAMLTQARAMSETSSLVSRTRVHIYKRVYRKADMVICQSEYMKQDLIREFGLDPSRVTRIYNPVDVESITRLATSEPSPYSRPGPNLVAVGRFTPEKGFDLLLQSMAIVRHNVPGAFLTVVGDGRDRPALEALQQDLHLQSHVQFVGAQANPYPFMRHADLLVLPSRCEALPNVLLESVSLGTPVATTPCTGAMGEITQCTKRVRVAAEITPEALADQILLSLSSRTALRKGAVEPQFLARFGVQAVTTEYEKLLWASTNRQPRPVSDQATAA